MSCNVSLQDCTRHTRTLSLLTDLEAYREGDFYGLGPFTEAYIGTHECALGERT
jgi:hypothetical protein